MSVLADIYISSDNDAASRVPAAMALQLAELSPDRIASVTSAWAATEELKCSPEDIKPTVDDLVRLARRANETNQNVYLWNCI